MLLHRDRSLLSHPQRTDTEPASPSTDQTTTSGARQDSHCSTNFEVTGMTRPEKAGFDPRISRRSNFFHLTQSQYTHTGPTSPSTDPIMPGARQDSHCSTSFEVTGMTRPKKAGFDPRYLPHSGRTLYRWLT